MNLLNDFVSYLKEEMDNNNITYGECNDLHDYVMRYFEVKERNIVFEEPYLILESDDFKEEKKLLDLDEKTILNEIYLKIQNGKNIDAYVPQDINKRKFDFLLSNWRIHHIHLQNKNNNGKFIFKYKAKVVLFVINYKTKQVGFINIIEHPYGTGWFKRRWLENIDNMFNDFLFYLDFVKDIEYDINNDAVIEEAEKKMHLFIKANGKVVSPNMGVATSGNSQLAVMKANDICNYFRRLEKDIVDNIDEYRKLIIANAKKYNIKLGKNVSKLDFTIIIEDNYVVLYETKYLMKIRLFDFTKYMN